MPFKKGDKRINRNGKPPGSTERVKRLRDFFFNLLEENKDQIQKDIDAMKPKDRAYYFRDCARLCLPPPEPVNLLDAMTDKDLDKIIRHLETHLNGHED